MSEGPPTIKKSSEFYYSLARRFHPDFSDTTLTAISTEELRLHLPGYSQGLRNAANSESAVSLRLEDWLSSQCITSEILLNY